MKEYFKTGAYSTPKEKKEARYLNEYANLYAQYIDDDEDHIYQHIEDNLLDVAPVNELKKRIHITKENIRNMLKKERIRSMINDTDNL